MRFGKSGKGLLLPAIFFKSITSEMHRAPFPHISPSLPSALKDAWRSQPEQLLNHEYPVGSSRLPPSAEPHGSIREGTGRKTVPVIQHYEIISVPLHLYKNHNRTSVFSDSQIRYQILYRVTTAFICYFTCLYGSSGGNDINWKFGVFVREKKKIVLLDGRMGTLLQKEDGHPLLFLGMDLHGPNPVTSIHLPFLEAGDFNKREEPGRSSSG